MTEYTSEDYTRANRLNARLASGCSRDEIRAARELSVRLLEHVRSKVSDYPDFVRRVENAEEFSLTESKQVSKAERELKGVYLRATSLAEAANEAEARAERTEQRAQGR